jgi:hypothetical protein
MALNFPSSPTNGQVFGDYTYDSTAGGWRSSKLEATGVPAGGTANQLLSKVNSTDYNTQWITAVPIANGGTGSTLGAGLVPVVPTSVVVAAGSASVGAQGLVTFTSATNVNLNGVFTSSFQNYKILFETETSAVPGSTFRLRASGTDASGATDYAWYGYRAISWSGAAGLNGSTGTSSWVVWDTNSGAHVNAMIMDIMRPAEAQKTKMISTGYTFPAGGSIGASYYSGHHKLSTAYDGISFINTAAFTGTMQVLGYAD